MNIATDVGFFDRVSFLDKLFFTKHLSVMIKSGIPLGDAIDAIREQSKKPALSKLLGSVLKDIDNGQSLERALSKHKNVFDPFYLNIIKIAEESGNLEQNLEYLAEQLKKNYEFTKKTQGALLYPGIVLFITALAGGAISIFVLPQLVTLFKDLDVKLPLSTQILLFFAALMRDYGYAIIIGFIVLFVGFRLSLKNEGVRYFFDESLLSMPLLGAFFSDVQLSFFCRNLGIMLRSGLPITVALEAQKDATSNLVFKKYTEDLAKYVEKGKTIAERLSEKKFPHIPLLATKMIGIGEKTGKLDESLMYLGDFYSEELDDYSKNFSTLLEPVILIVIGLAVGFIALAVISPIYQLTSGIHR